MKNTRKNKFRLNMTQKNIPQPVNLNIITKIDNIINKKQIKKLKKIIDIFFKKEILSRLENCKRPIVDKYGDLIERQLGRFEITPSSSISKKIWKLLNQSNDFISKNKAIKKIIHNSYKHVREELCIIPLESNTIDGNWHRDIFVRSKLDFDKSPFYITQIIYLDANAGTDFCENSKNNDNNNVNLYKKKTIQAKPGSSIIFDGRTLHKGNGNKTDKIRYAIYISYFEENYIDKESNMKTILDKNVTSLCNL